MHMIKKRQMEGAEVEGLATAKQFYAMAA